MAAMARHLPAILLLSSALLLALASASAAAPAQAAFVDAASRRYLRDQQHHDQAASMSLDQVSAAVSVLLGFAPPPSLPSQSSSKLDKLLFPNPFDRPRAVFLLQIDGFHDKDDLVIVHSDESPDFDSGSEYFDSDLTDLANWLGGSYEKVDGKLIIPLESGESLTLLITKEADMEFASSLISLRKTIKRGIQVHEDFSGGVMSPAELLVCHFKGIKALEEEYGSTEIVKQGTDVVRTAVTKAFDLLRGAYNGKVDKNFFSFVMHVYMHYPSKFVQVKFSCGTQEQKKKSFGFGFNSFDVLIQEKLLGLLAYEYATYQGHPPVFECEDRLDGIRREGERLAH
uniref:DUF7794 domain-containing protein n=1 Tax=Oryza meridionalis TaxID=40149 RepID=A0A0E0EP87_9ORYZ